ncbi:hypothetical protein ATANTOWER_025544 [Ataeniobius toweri]|uniref:C3H1-type domain-containing protein n=1 Tax=Ataeniobius toweri TaxID=208326 RepID=A0ABU7C9M0_9TELE|nr:hypothetical protein [Ataeniobius toweri]
MTVVSSANLRSFTDESDECKKKHTLVCPDFSKTGSCPRSSRCKLQHRQRVKRSASSTSTVSDKRGCSKEPFKRPHLSVVIPQDAKATPGTPIAGPLALPSFISLSSSPEEADAPNSPLADPTQVKGVLLKVLETIAALCESIVLSLALLHSSLDCPWCWRGRNGFTVDKCTFYTL